MILLRYDSLTTDKLKVLSSEMDPAEIIGSFDWSSLRERRGRLLDKSACPTPFLRNLQMRGAYIAAFTSEQ
jgi:hypothetical protein